MLELCLPGAALSHPSDKGETTPRNVMVKRYTTEATLEEDTEEEAKTTKKAESEESKPDDAKAVLSKHKQMNVVFPAFSVE